MNYRNVFARLATSLIRDKKYDQAIEVLDKATEMTVHANLEHNFYSLALAEAYYLAGAKEKGRELTLSILKQFGDEYKYMSKFPKGLKSRQNLEMRRNQQLLRAAQGILKNYDPQGS